MHFMIKICTIVAFCLVEYFLRCINSTFSFTNMILRLTIGQHFGGNVVSLISTSTLLGNSSWKSRNERSVSVLSAWRLHSNRQQSEKSLSSLFHSFTFLPYFYPVTRNQYFSQRYLFCSSVKGTMSFKKTDDILSRFLLILSITPIQLMAWGWCLSTKVTNAVQHQWQLEKEKNIMVVLALPW